MLEEFRPLTEKYGVPQEDVWDGRTLTPMAAILEKFERNEELELEEVKWLEDQEKYREVAVSYYLQYRASNNLWDIVRTCAKLRKANLSENAIDLLAETNKAATQDPKLASALLTTKGAAHRDMGELDTAKELADKAIKITPKGARAYNLKGAILYEEGKPEEGDGYFEKALRLGASIRSRDAEVRNVLKKSTEIVRRKVIDYLLEKDEKKYQWVKKYLS